MMLDAMPFACSIAALALSKVMLVFFAIPVFHVCVLEESVVRPLTLPGTNKFAESIYTFKSRS